MTKRRVRLRFNGQSQQQATEIIGVPQGSPVSPILFLIYVRGLLAKRGLQLSYIDDFSISVASGSARKNCRLLKEIATELFREAANQQAPFNHSKTELIHFSRKRETPRDPVILPGLTVEPSPVIRWLGI